MPRWALWVPVLFAVGIAVYFELPVEPPPPVAGLLALALGGALAAARLWPQGDLMFLALATILAGVLAAWLATWQEAAPVLDQIRAAGLAHLLAISGLHMGLVTGFVFFLLRAVMALLPPLALRWPIKKFAALSALAAAATYFALSGAAAPAERAFVMVTVALVAVVLDRVALSLRSLALAAVVVLAL